MLKVLILLFRTKNIAIYSIFISVFLYADVTYSVTFLTPAHVYAINLSSFCETYISILYFNFKRCFLFSTSKKYYQFWNMNASMNAHMNAHMMRSWMRKSVQTLSFYFSLIKGTIVLRFNFIFKLIFRNESSFFFISVLKLLRLLILNQNILWKWYAFHKRKCMPNDCFRSVSHSCYSIRNKCWWKTHILLHIKLSVYPKEKKSL